MVLFRRILSGTTILASGHAGGQFCAFLRNIIVARLISPHDFGIAATFVVAIAALGAISDLALDRLLVQAEDGDAVLFQDTAHLVMVVRGFLIAAFVLILAWPVTTLFRIPEARWAFQCLAVVPLVRGFAHLDRKRLHRTMRFGKDTVVELIGQMIPLLAAWPLAAWLQGYSAVLWLLIIQTCAIVTASHLVAERPYRWAWNTIYLRRMFAFGWPLLVNGALIFGILYGDRVIVGTGYTMSELGYYSVACTLTIIPTVMCVRVGSTVLLPLLSTVQNDAPQFYKRYAMYAQTLCLVAAPVSTAFIVGGPFLVTEIFGSEYARAGAVIGWLAAMEAVRLMRRAPTVAAMAKGDTKTVMLSNIARSVAVGLAIAAASVHAELRWIAASGFVGEVLALACVLFRLTRLHGISAAACLWPLSFLMAALLVASGIAMEVPASAGWLGIFVASGTMASAVLVAMFVFVADFRNQILKIILSLRQTEPRATL